MPLLVPGVVGNARWLCWERKSSSSGSIDFYVGNSNWGQLPGGLWKWIMDHRLRDYKVRDSFMISWRRLGAGT